MARRTSEPIESLPGSEGAVIGTYTVSRIISTTRIVSGTAAGRPGRASTGVRVKPGVDDDIVYQEIALYKVPTQVLLEEQDLESIIRHHSVRILEMTPDYTVLEKAGHRWETDALFETLRRYDIRQFVRSGRVCVTKSPVEYMDLYLEEQLKRREERNDNKENNPN